MIQLRALEKEEQGQLNIIVQKEIQSGQKSMKQKEKNYQKSGLFEKINKINKPLANLTKRNPGKTQINKIRDEKGDITTDNMKLRKLK